MYYLKIEGNGDLPADDRARRQDQQLQHVFTFHSFNLPRLWGLLIFFKIFRFGGSIPLVRFRDRLTPKVYLFYFARKECLVIG